jgi:hypothetical protein
MCQSTQHLARVLKITAPQQRRTLARQSVRLICDHGVIGEDHALRRGRSAFGEPARRARFFALGPVKNRGRL